MAPIFTRGQARTGPWDTSNLEKCQTEEDQLVRKKQGLWD